MVWMDNLASTQNSSCDGSLSDILQLPAFQNHHTLESIHLPHYNNSSLLLQSEEPFRELPVTIPSPPLPHSLIPIGDDHFNTDQDFYRDHPPFFTEQHLNAPPIINFNYDAHNVVLPSSPRLAPVSIHTARRPPLRKGTPCYREAHIQSERQRRQDMTYSFNRLRSLLPSLQDNDLQADRCTILGQVIKYVQELDSKVQELQKVKAHLLQEEEKRKVNKEDKEEDPKKVVDGRTTNVSVRSWGNLDIFITLNCPKECGLWPNLIALLQDTLQLDVQNVALSSTPLFCVHSIYAKVATKENQGMSCEILEKVLGNFVADHVHKNNIY